MMSGHYSFTSCFAPFIESMITEKRNAGFQYEHAEWILHKFDEFCNQERKGQILRSTPNTAPLICGACNTQPEGILTTA